MANRTLTFNRVHKNGWISYKLQGIAGAVFIDKRMLTAEALATPPTTMVVEIEGIVEPGAEVVAKSAADAEKKAERERVKAEKASKAIEKANARLAKLQEAATKAAEKAAAAAARTTATDGQ